jgi:hypothetical protein
LWLALAATLLLAFAAPVRRVGDGHQYHAMAHALAQLRPPALSPEDVAEFRRWVDTQPPGSGFGAGAAENPRLFAAGRQDFPHFWFYSLLAAPLVVIARAVGAHENFAFVALNSLLLIVAVWRAQKAFSPGVALLVLASPIVWFVNKAHTEVFTFSLLCIAMSEARQGRYLLAGLSAATASTQNPPILAAVLCFWAAGVVRQVFPRGILEAAPLRDVLRTWSTRHSLMVACTILIGGLHPLYYWLRLGAYTPQALTGNVRPNLPSLERYLVILLDPDLGFVAWLPVVTLLAVPGLVLLCRKWQVDAGPELDLRLAAACGLASGALFLFAFTQGSSVNGGGTIHIRRHALWLLPLALPLLEPVTRWLGRRWPYVIPSLGVASFAVYLSYFRPSAPPNFMAPSPQARVLYAWLPSAYRPWPEIFYERRTGVRAGARNPDPGTAANEACTLILLSRREPPTRCALSDDELREAEKFFGEGWRSVWVVRPGRLGIGSVGVFGQAREQRGGTLSG